MTKLYHKPSKLNLIVTLLSVIVLAGCSTGKRIIVLQHPETKQTVECQADPWATFDQKGVTEQCAKDYEAAGYKRLSSEN